MKNIDKFLLSRSWLFATLALLALLFLPAPTKNSPLFVARLFDAAHVPLFALVSYLIRLGLDRLENATRLSFLITSLIASSTELIQPLAGRSTSLYDILWGMLGTAIGLALFHRRKLCSSVFRVLLLSVACLLCILLSLLPAYQAWKDRELQLSSLPELGHFENAQLLRFWEPFSIRGSKPPIALSHSCARNEGLGLSLAILRSDWTGLVYRADGSDWSQYQGIEFSVFSLEDGLSIWVRIDDMGPSEEFSQRFSKIYQLKAGWNDIRLNFKELEDFPFSRPFDLSEIESLMFFFESNDKKRLICFDQIGLLSRTPTAD